MESIESKFNRVVAENGQLKEALRQERVLKAQVELETKIAGLPPDAKERLRKAFPGADLGGLKQAINVEKRGAQ